MIVDRADNCRYRISCVVEACNWRIHDAVLSDNVSWAINIQLMEAMYGKVYPECEACNWRIHDAVLSDNVSWATSIPLMEVESLQKLCMERFRLNVKQRLFYKVKVVARERIHGGFAESYALLPRFAEMIKSTNPRSYALITCSGDSGTQEHQFKACLFSLDATMKGFLGGCRPIIGIDGAHLSGYYKGIMLNDVGFDGNNKFFVIAYAIGVKSALYEVFLEATRRVCCQHLYSNCKNARWSNAMFHNLFWIAANAYNEYVFKKAMSKIKEYDVAFKQYLRNVEEQWLRKGFDSNVCCDHNTTNLVDSFNSYTKPHRDMLVLALLIAVKNWIMKRVGARFDKAIDMDPNILTEHAQQILQTRSSDYRFFHVTSYGGGEFEVRDGHVKFPIRLTTMTCGCGK
ncbi:uncharacterized protein LOC110723345 [Chenopodium quinoa]|uniref:uncharacterized protein LOC110723345 n=1 Tax=Chenopodium quinoa TaxID=63459 RepID=UPI000B77689B|nr:uncharacterized protein LOC110723345 [Chenopodium quinoa]